jgi:rhodanese-related sulfurtransferase
MSLTSRPRVRIAALALIAALAVVCRAGGAAAEPSEISAREAWALAQAGNAPFFIDVRTPQEFAAGHVPGAVNIPRDQIPEHRAELAAAQDRLVVYCERGPRALAAAATLESEGFKQVRHLSGDMAGWRAAGLPIEK